MHLRPMFDRGDGDSVQIRHDRFSSRSSSR